MGLIFGRDSFTSTAPAGVAIAAGFFLLVSLAAAVGAFANRGYEIAPNPEQVATLAGASEEWIRWRLLGNLLDAADTNRDKLLRKARWLVIGQSFLLVSLAPLGGYFIHDSIRRIL